MYRYRYYTGTTGTGTTGTTGYLYRYYWYRYYRYYRYTGMTWSICCVSLVQQRSECLRHGCYLALHDRYFIGIAAIDLGVLVKLIVMEVLHCERAGIL